MRKIDVNEELVIESQNGNLDMVRHLLTSSFLQEKASISYLLHMPLKVACVNNKLNVVEYLLTSDELTEHSNVQIDNNYCLRWACEREHLDILLFILTSPKIPNKPNFIECIDFIVKFSSSKVFHYLVFDCNIPYDEKIEAILINKKYDDLHHIFQIRESYKKLQKEIIGNDNPIHIQKVKI